MYLSVIIPAYNEEKVIGETVQTISRYCESSGFSHEIIVVNDGSKDRTGEILKTLSSTIPSLRIVNTQNNHGKGWAVREGVQAAEGDYILYCDADLSTPIEEMKKLLVHLEKNYDIAIGSRSLVGSTILIHQPWWREGMGKIFNGFVRLLLLKDFKDTQCGFKCFKGEAAKKLFLISVLNGFAFDVEILFLAVQLKYRVIELPIVWRNNPASRVNPFLHPYQMILDLLYIKFRLHRKISVVSH